jgi:hypothetical protein
MKKINAKIFCKSLFFIVFFSNSPLIAQIISPTAPQLAPGVTSPIGKDTSRGVTIQLVAACDGNDVRVFPSAIPQTEIHLSINKLNPNVLLLSSNTFPVTNCWQGAYWSTNGGTVWAGADRLPNNVPGRGDPSTAFDIAGNGYIATMTYAAADIIQRPNGYAVQRTANNGTLWQPQISGSGIIGGFDKEMIAADDIATSPNANNLYCAWTNLNSANRIQFNRSVNRGASFTVPIFLSAGDGQGANVQTGTNGEVYVCWSDYAGNAANDISAKGLGFCRSTTGGVSFTSGQRMISYTGIRAFNAITGHEENPLFNGIRVNDFPAMSVDKSSGTRRGRIYVVVPVRENGNGKAVIQISWSDNQGTSWSPLKTISIANGRQNWFPWISVDATNGNVYAIYYSLDATAGFATNTYVAVSNDNGATFLNQRVSDVAHVTGVIDEFAEGYAGDYIGITSHGGRAFAAWTDNRSGQWQNYVSQVSNADVLGENSFCTSSAYSVTNIPLNSSVTWSVTPSGIVTLTQANNRATLTRVTNGLVTLRATVLNACGGTSLLVSKPVTSGNPFPTGVTTAVSNSTNFTGPLQSSVSFFMPAGNSGLATFNITDTRFSSFNWTPVSIPSGASWQTFGALRQQLNINITANGAAFTQTTATVRLSAQGPCGAYTSNFSATAVVSSASSPAFSISPNPAASTVTVNAKSDELNTDAQTGAISEIRIYDMQGNLKKTQKFGGVTTAQIDVSSLKPDIYIIDVFDGAISERQQLLIQR